MMLKIDDYAYNGGLKDVHPIEKSIFALSFLFLTMITKNPITALITFIVMSISIVYGARVPFYHYLKLLLLPSFFLFSSMIAILISITPMDSERSINAVWSFETRLWQIYVSGYSINQTFRLAATVLASVSCMYFLILTTPLHQMIWLLQKIKLPTLFIELVVFTYRFIFVLLEKMYEIYISQSSRLGYQNYRIWLNSIAQLIVSLFIKSALAARELQISIDSRGGGSADTGLFEVELRMKHNRWHYAGIILSVATLLIVSILT